MGVGGRNVITHMRQAQLAAEKQANSKAHLTTFNGVIRFGRQWQCTWAITGHEAHEATITS